jgi:hypothetical protein
MELPQCSCGRLAVCTEVWSKGFMMASEVWKCVNPACKHYRTMIDPVWVLVHGLAPDQPKNGNKETSL